MEQKQQIHLDLSQTQTIKDSKGNQIWQEALLLRKIPGLLIGSKTDQLYPIPIFISQTTGEILQDSLPQQLWEEFGFKQEPKKESNLKIVK